MSNKQVNTLGGKDGWKREGRKRKRGLSDGEDEGGVMDGLNKHCRLFAMRRRRAEG